MVSELDYPDRLWAPAAERDRAELAGTLRPGQAAVHSRLNWYVDGQLEHFRSKRLARWAPQVSCDADEVPERVKQPIPRFRIPRRYPLKRRWMDLLQPLQAIESRAADGLPPTPFTSPRRGASAPASSPPTTASPERHRTPLRNSSRPTTESSTCEERPFPRGSSQPPRTAHGGDFGVDRQVSQRRTHQRR